MYKATITKVLHIKIESNNGINITYYDTCGPGHTILREEPLVGLDYLWTDNLDKAVEYTRKRLHETKDIMVQLEEEMRNEPVKSEYIGDEIDDIQKAINELEEFYKQQKDAIRRSKESN